MSYLLYLGSDPFTTDCGAPNVDETWEFASSGHAQVSKNRMQFVDENDVSNLTSIQNFFAPLLVISNILNVMNTKFGFDFVVLNESQPLECVLISHDTKVYFEKVTNEIT